MLKARFFQLFFKIPSFRKHYFGLYSKVFEPLGWFKNSSTVSKYDGDLRIKLDIGEWIQQQIFFLGVFDEAGINFIKNNLKKDDVFMDIGANIGCYTLIAAKLVGSGGKVYSFEPVSDVYERLRLNISLNRFKNVTAEKKAVSETKGQLKLYVSSAGNTGMSGIFHHDSESGKTENVEAVTLDEYITAHGIKRLDVVKIDIEGSELYALKGMEKTLAELKPILIVEISNGVLENSPIKSTDIINFLESRSYIRKAIAIDGAPVEVTTSSSGNYHNYAFFPEW